MWIGLCLYVVLLSVCVAVPVKHVCDTVMATYTPDETAVVYHTALCLQSYNNYMTK